MKGRDIWEGGGGDCQVRIELGPQLMHTSQRDWCMPFKAVSKSKNGLMIATAVMNDVIQAVSGSPFAEESCTGTYAYRKPL